MFEDQEGASEFFFEEDLKKVFKKFVLEQEGKTIRQTTQNTGVRQSSDMEYENFVDDVSAS